MKPQRRGLSGLFWLCDGNNEPNMRTNQRAFGLSRRSSRCANCAKHGQPSDRLPFRGGFIHRIRSKNEPFVLGKATLSLRGIDVHGGIRGDAEGTSKRIMDVEVSDFGAEVCRDGEAEPSPTRELYGCSLARLPKALVLALAEPLLLQLAPSRQRPVVQLPSRIPSWWSAAPLRRARSTPRRKVETGKLEPTPAR